VLLLLVVIHDLVVGIDHVVLFLRAGGFAPGRLFGAAGAGWDESGGTTSVSAAPLCFGRLRVDANASPKTKAIATRVPNFNQSRVRTGISVSSV